jgi:hypothetical protein
MAVTRESRVGPRSEPRIEKGISLARGPALILGTILLAVGLYFIYKQHDFPKFSNFPSGTATVKGKVLFGIFGGNGWTGMLTAIAGGLLLFGAAQHLLAKTMSLIVGVVLAVAAILALLNHGNVLGLASANHMTELAWGVAAVILLFNTLIPRRTRTIEPAYGDGVAERRAGGGRVAAGAAAGAGAGAVAEHEHDRHRERVAEREAGGDRPAAGARGADGAGDGGAGRRHAAEAAVAGAGAGALAEHEHDKHRARREANGAPADEPRGERGAAVNEPSGDGNPDTQVTTGRAGPRNADRSENATAAQGGSAGSARGGQTASGGQVGLAERARRWLRPGSEN